MYGAIIGDLAGSIYEYNQFNKVSSVKVENIISDNAFYSDDTILTMAIMDAIMNDRNYGKYLRKYINKYSNYLPSRENYFDTIFSPNLIKWAKSNSIGTSSGNGAMMRVSSVGYLFNTEEEVITNARLATIPSHNSEEAIECATKVALIIYYLRVGLSLHQVYSKLNINPVYKKFDSFNYTCGETINNCLYIVKNSNSFEDAIRKVIELGGDTDTNACIVGSIAEALYGIPNYLIEKANKFIPDEFKKLLNKYYE